MFVQVRDVLEAGTIEPVGSSYQEFWLMASLSTANNPNLSWWLRPDDQRSTSPSKFNDAIELVSHPVRRLIARRAAGNWWQALQPTLALVFPAVFRGCAARRRALSKFMDERRARVHNGMMLDDALFGCARNADALFHHSINLNSTVAAASISPSRHGRDGSIR